MSRIKVKKFGPIKSGFDTNDGYIDIKKTTVFIGENGSGKSSIAKLISIFTWLEKSIIRDGIFSNKINKEGFYTLCQQQDIEEYFTNETEIYFEGDLFKFAYKNKTFSVEKLRECENYKVPKIQYFSSARNLLTILATLKTVQINLKSREISIDDLGIPFMVKVLTQEYSDALNSPLTKEGFALPIRDSKLFFDKGRVFIETENKKISMACSCSGLQSVAPLLLVSSYLSDYVKKDFFKRNEINSGIESGIKKANLESEFERYINAKMLTGDARNSNLTSTEIEKIENILKKFVSSRFVSIVEEPEQNLFPSSQRSLLNKLLEFNNEICENSLIISTHSPYIVGYLSLAVKAHEANLEFAKNGETEKQKKLARIVPQESHISVEDVAVYECYADGSLRELEKSHGMLCDAHFLDRELGEINDRFSEIFELEDM